MRKLTAVVNHVTQNADPVMMAITQDGEFDRDAILLIPENLPGQAISMDVLVAIGGLTYHVARLNFAIPEDGNGKTNMDVCIPDGAKQDILVFSDGAIKVNWRNLDNKAALLAFVCTPGAPVVAEETLADYIKD